MNSAPSQGLNQLAEAGRLESESLEAEKAQGQGSADGQASKAQGTSTTPKGKVRKAYTITKQRERWTDSEHDRFLQALKRYGRAWRKIEEHIGTKTAVQIRSHAQKFFSKLQREQGSGGSLTDGSSKAGISIPPPRPKRKPMHPYPRKSGEGGDAAGASQQPSSSLQTSHQALPQLPAFPSLDLNQHGGVGIGDASITAVLEAAAIAAANAWSQVVARAGAQVQKQLQVQRAAAPQTLPFYGINPAMLGQMANAQAPPPQFRPTVGATALQSSTQEPTGRSGSTLMANRCTPDISLTGTSDPRAAGGTQSNYDSPTGDDQTGDADGGDSACSREDNRDPEMPQRDSGASSYGRQHLDDSAWKEGSQQEQRLSRAAWNMVAQAANAAATSQWNPHDLAKPPQRAFSAGAVITVSGRQPAKEGPGSPKLGRSKSQTSQLAHNYQRAAAAEQQAMQQAINDAENGSSGDGSNSGDGSGKLGLLRSDKGSNAGSDGDGQGSGSGSDNGATDPADQIELTANAEKGSDDGSNSPGVFAGNSSPVTEADKGQAPAATVVSVGSPKASRNPQVFSKFDPVRMAAAATQLQQQGTHATLSMPQPFAPQKAFAPQQQALAAYQQQAMAAWTAGATAQPGFHLLHSLFKGVQVAGRRDYTPAVAFATPGESSLLDRKSSGQPSLDHFLPTSSRSHSLPTTGNLDAQLAGEEVSGFQPYNKRHGMPLTSLPPAKRFAADAGKDNATKPAVKAVGFSPFSLRNSQHMQQ